MASTVGRIHGWSWWVGCAILAATLGAQEAAAQEALVPGSPGRIRPIDAKAASLIQAGRQRSSTFRRLVEVIEQSDLIVLVQAGHLQHQGQLQFIAATPYSRYVRVAVRLPGLENDLLGTLAHELQHAVEIAGAPEVRDHASLVRFYQLIGRGGRPGATVLMETSNAQKTGAKVLNELLDATPQAVRR